MTSRNLIASEGKNVRFSSNSWPVAKCLAGPRPLPRGVLLQALMDEILVELTDDEWKRVNELPCEQAALEICRIHLRRCEPSVTFVTPGKGADLRVRQDNGLELDIEVKGTEAAGLAWAQLKVSSQQSYDRLKSGMALYRVTGIRSRAVRLFVMRYGADFEMVPEPRWSVRPSQAK